jgi:hypothetical protein
MTELSTYYSKEVIELMKKNMRLSPSTAHKIMNPYCGQCMLERGKKLIENAKTN